MTTEEYVINRLRMLDEEVLKLRDKNLEKVFKMNDLQGQIQTANELIENLLLIASDCYLNRDDENTVKKAKKYLMKHCPAFASKEKKKE